MQLHRELSYCIYLIDVELQAPDETDGSPKATAAGAAGASSARSLDGKLPVGFLSASKDSYLQLLLNRYVVPVLFHPAGKAICTLIVVAMVVLGAIGATRLEQGLNEADLAPDGHYIKTFFTLDSRFETSSGVCARDALHLCFTL